MTEAEWAVALDPIQMLHAKGLPIPLDEVRTARWRFFYAGCLRFIWDHLSDDERRAVEAAEDFSLGLVTAEHLEQFIPAPVRANNLNDQNYWSLLSWFPQNPRFPASVESLRSANTLRLQTLIWRMIYVTDFEKSNPGHQAGYSADRAHEFLRVVQMAMASQRAGPAPPEASHPDHPWHAAFMSVIQDVNILGADLLRCVVGNPFRVIDLDPDWQTSSVDGLMEGIRHDKAYDRLPILADALEEAGCTDEFVLNHCRYQARHSIGCWAAHLEPRPAQTKPSTGWFG